MLEKTAMDGASLVECQKTLADHAAAADDELAWPAASWQALARAGVLGWSVPQTDGGAGLDHLALLSGYEQIASACLTTCFVLSQRESAMRHLKNLADASMRRELIRPLLTGESFATVGLSQLTTSRQHQQPVLRATRSGGKLILDGSIPWVTGAAQARHIVIGAVTEDNLQVLAVLPTDKPGVHIEPPLDLMALRGSLTAGARLDGVELGPEWVLAGPAERVLAAGKGGAGGLETSCLAIGLAASAINYVQSEAALRPDLRESAQNLQQERAQLRQEMHRLAGAGPTAEEAAELRGRANSLVLRATQVALTAGKGTGFLRSHPAQRWARQALFFLVWSCPRPTTQAMLAQLAPGGECLL
jgi:alkylation response protein AidB-like acyl-CoA dehydrogenase